MNIVCACILVLDLLIPFLIAIPYQGFSHSHQVMSVLGCKESPWGRVYNVWMVASGLAVCAAGIGLFRQYGIAHTGAGIALMVLMIVYGAGDEILSGIFPLEESTRTTSRVSKIHGVGSVIGFLALLFVPIPLAVLAYANSYNAVGGIAIACFLLTLVCFAAFVMGDKPRSQNTPFALEGLWQRLVCLFAYVPIVLLLLVG